MLYGTPCLKSRIRTPETFECNSDVADTLLYSHCQSAGQSSGLAESAGSVISKMGQEFPDIGGARFRLEITHWYYFTLNLNTKLKTDCLSSTTSLT